MFASFPVARAFGITFRVDWTWIAFTLLLALTWDGDPRVALLNWLLVFFIVFLHEVGHSVMARSLEIEVKDITLSFFGGYTRMGWGKRQEQPLAEILVALAGPATNIVLGLLAAPIAALSLSEGFRGLEPGLTTSLLDLAKNFCLFNLALGFSNLAPLLPLDGGRVLRGTLGIFLDWLTATRIVAVLGRFGAVALIVLGFLWSSWVSVLIGFVVWRAASQEVWLVRARRAQERAKDGFDPLGAAPAQFTRVDPEPAAQVEPDSAATRARRPADNPLAEHEGQLDDEAIKRLEQFRGRLRKRDDEDAPSS